MIDKRSKQEFLIMNIANDNYTWRIHKGRHSVKLFIRKFDNDITILSV